VILADTSVWIDHFRTRDSTLEQALTEGEVLTHPFVLGELACGNFKNRAEILDLLRQLPPAREATDDETLTFIERRRLMGRGVGYIDAHLLAAALLTKSARLWTRDKRLAGIALELGVGFPS
jgi:predicted nucleic acid-binding protein